MSDTIEIPVKKTRSASSGQATRRKTAVSTSASAPTALSSILEKQLKTQEEAFLDLIAAISNAKDEFIALQKQITETREVWEKERKRHEEEVREQIQQEEVERRREKESYEYETQRARKQIEDEFSEKRVKWEKELASKKEELEQDKKELEELRKHVAGFEGEMQKAVKDACSALEEELTDEFSTKEKMREQEFKAEKEILALRITNLTSENARQTQEIASLKSSLEEATRQLKDVAVKVIESSSPKQPFPQEPKVA